jgi:hypothetical protein
MTDDTSGSLTRLSFNAHHLVTLDAHMHCMTRPVVCTGVIVGNYRCSLAGCDLNRVWHDPLKKLHPTIYSLKALIKSLSEEREVSHVCALGCLLDSSLLVR